MNPAMILIRPQMGENIGAAARVMANFGLTNLRLVAPRDGWPNPKAADMAARALSILDDAMVYATAAEAVADTQFVLATT
ncbi:MAG: TrmH family RNA methyltransferase, partial [Alphaproteobacteria bacterium]